jgi:hypothetical protein
MRISPDENTVTIITKLAQQTGMSFDTLLNKLIAPQLQALYEIEELLATLPPHTERYDAVLNLLQSYSHDETLMQGVERLAPTGYKTLERRFLDQLSGIANTQDSQLQVCQ